MDLKTLKTSAEIVAQTLLEIINVSLLNGQFPEAKIKPIHKGGPKSDPSNYRPTVLNIKCH